MGFVKLSQLLASLAGHDHANVHTHTLTHAGLLIASWHAYNATEKRPDSVL